MKIFILLLLAIFSCNVFAVSKEEMRENTKKFLQSLPADATELVPIVPQSAQKQLTVRQVDGYGNPTKDGIIFVIKDESK